MNDIRQGAISIIYKESNRKLAQEVDSLKTQLAHQTTLLREALEAINSLTGFSECIYDCSIVPTYQESEAAASDIVVKIYEALEKIK